MADYVGKTVLEVDGVEYEIMDLDYEVVTGLKTFQPMARDDYPRKFRAAGGGTVTGTFTSPIPDYEIQTWRGIENARIRILNPNGVWKEALDAVGVESVGSKFGPETEAQRSVKFHGFLAASGLAA